VARDLGTFIGEVRISLKGHIDMRETLLKEEQSLYILLYGKLLVVELLCNGFFNYDTLLGKDRFQSGL
jgi:hypothetical protein